MCAVSQSRKFFYGVANMLLRPNTGYSGQTGGTSAVFDQISYNFESGALNEERLTAGTNGVFKTGDAAGDVAGIDEVQPLSPADL